MAHVAKQKRPEGRVSARVIKANGEVIELGQIAGPGITRADAKKGRDGRKRLNDLFKKEGGHGR